MNLNKCQEEYSHLSNFEDRNYRIISTGEKFVVRKIKLCKKENLKTADGLELIKTNKALKVNQNDDCEVLIIHDIEGFKFHEWSKEQNNIEWID